MASTFRPTYNRPIPPEGKCCRLNGKPAVRYTDRRGKVHTRPLTADGRRMVCQQSHWWMRYTLPDGTERRSKGFTDKTATEQEAARREREAIAAAAGLVLVDDKHLSAPVADHLQSYLDDLERSGRSHKHKYVTKKRLERVFRECGWLTLSTVKPDSLSSFLGQLKRNGAASKTVNEYLSTAKAFLNWCVRQRRLAANPLSGIAPTDRVEKTRRRRALTVEQARRLLAVAGPRRLVYLTALQTGLRRSELGELHWEDLHIEANEPRPHIALRAETTKAHRGDVVPLRKDLAAKLRGIRPARVDSSTTVFESIPKMEVFRRDLAAADIDYVDSSGRVADFHALRYSLGTMLAQTGAAPRTAMEVMRHTDLRLTMNVYTDPRLLDTASAVEQLPNLDGPVAESGRAVRTGTDDRPIVNGFGKVLTKSTTQPVFSGRSVAQKGLDEADNGIPSEAPKSTEQPEYGVSSYSKCSLKKLPKVGVEPTPGVNRTGF